MSYRINGQRLGRKQAAAYIVAAMIAAGYVDADRLQQVAEDYLFTLRPGEAREYARARISCEYAV